MPRLIRKYLLSFLTAVIRHEKKDSPKYVALLLDAQFPIYYSLHICPFFLIPGMSENAPNYRRQPSFKLPKKKKSRLPFFPTHFHRRFTELSQFTKKRRPEKSLQIDLANRARERATSSSSRNGINYILQRACRNYIVVL